MSQVACSLIHNIYHKFCRYHSHLLSLKWSFTVLVKEWVSTNTNSLGSRCSVPTKFKKLCLICNASLFMSLCLWSSSLIFWSSSLCTVEPWWEVTEVAQLLIGKAENLGGVHIHTHHMAMKTKKNRTLQTTTLKPTTAVRISMSKACFYNIYQNITISAIESPSPTKL